MIHNLAQAQRANAQAGQHFFSPSTMKFFRSRISRTFYPLSDGGAYFVTSEADSDGRRYSVRHITEAGEVATVGESQQYATLAQAHRAARALRYAVIAAMAAALTEEER